MVQTGWGMFLFFFFFVLPCFFIYGMVKKAEEIKREYAEEGEKKPKASKPPKEETPAYEPPIETYKTVKKEPGSYAVVGPDNMEAIVIRVETPNDGKYWIAILPLKEAKKSERVKTKKEAVALAIELLKEHKESKNGS